MCTCYIKTFKCIHMIIPDNSNFLPNAVSPYQRYHNYDSLLNSHIQKNFRFTWLRSNAMFLDDIRVMPRYFTELTHCICIGLSHRYIGATLHWYLGTKAIQCDFLSLNCKHNYSLAVITLISSNFWSPEDDNSIRSSAYMIHDTQHQFIWQPLLFINTLLMNISA